MKNIQYLLRNACQYKSNYISAAAIRFRSSTVAVADEENTAKSFASIPGPTRLPVIGNLHLFSRFGKLKFFLITF